MYARNLGYSKLFSSSLRDSIEARDAIETAIIKGYYFGNQGIIDLDANEQFIILGRTQLESAGTDSFIRMPSVKSDVAGVKIYGYKNTIYTGGTPSPPINYNFKSSNTTNWQDSVVYPNITDNGTLFYQDYIAGTSSGPFADSGVSEQHEFFLLDFDTVYMLIVQNVDSANTIHFQINVAEPPIQI